MKRITALILIIAIFALIACGCQGEAGNTTVIDNADTVVMSYEGCTLSSGMYAFIFSALKTNYLYLLQLYGESDFVEDTEIFWNMKSENGKTFAETVTDDINSHCKMLLICKKMASEYSVTLDQESIEAVEDEYNDYIASYGSEKELEKFLKKYGLTGTDLTEYLKMKQTIIAVQQKLCAKDGICAVKDEDVYAQIEKEYIKAKHIYLLDSKYDKKALDKANELLKQINNGEKKYQDFADMSDDNSTSEYPDGFLVKIEETEERYAKTLEGLKVGECAVCEADDGAYLITRLEMTDDDKKTRYDTVWAEIADSQFADLLANRYDQVELNSEELDKYDIITADILQ